MLKQISKTLGLIVLVALVSISWSAAASEEKWSLEEAAKPYKGQTINFIGEDTDSVTACQKVASKEFTERTGIKVDFTLAISRKRSERAFSLKGR